MQWAAPSQRLLPAEPAFLCGDDNNDSYDDCDCDGDGDNDDNHGDCDCDGHGDGCENDEENRTGK